MKTLKERTEQRKNGEVSKEELKTFLQEYYDASATMTIGEDTAFRQEIGRWKDAMGISVERLNMIFKETMNHRDRTATESMVDDMIKDLPPEESIKLLEKLLEPESTASQKAKAYMIFKVEEIKRGIK